VSCTRSWNDVLVRPCVICEGYRTRHIGDWSAYTTDKAGFVILNHKTDRLTHIKLPDLVQHCLLWDVGGNLKYDGNSSFFWGNSPPPLAGQSLAKYLEEQERLAIVCTAVSRALDEADRGVGASLGRTADPMAQFQQLFVQRQPVVVPLRGAPAGNAPVRPVPGAAQLAAAAPAEPAEEEAGEPLPDADEHDRFENPREAFHAAIRAADVLRTDEDRYHAALVEWVNATRAGTAEEVKRAADQVAAMRSENNGQPHPEEAVNLLRAMSRYHATQHGARNAQITKWATDLLRQLSQHVPGLAAEPLALDGAPSPAQVLAIFKEFPLKDFSLKCAKWFCDNNVPLPFDFLGVRFIQDEMGSIIAGKRGKDTGRLFLGAFPFVESGGWMDDLIPILFSPQARSTSSWATSRSRRCSSATPPGTWARCCSGRTTCWCCRT
jgi:hypothetical protein